MFEKYDAYKDSGLESFPEIPADWQLKKLKFLLDEVNIRSETGDETLLSLSKYKGVIPKDSLDERAGGASTLVGYKKVFKYNLVINKMQAVNGLLAVSELEGITSPDYSVYSAKDNSVNIHYIAFLLNQPEYLAEMKKRVTGVMEGFIRLYTDDLYDIKAILPSITEQNCIVDFLQKKLVEIDQAIAIKEQQIVLLNERKQIVIQKTVTQGLDPNVPMKDSGLNSVGNIPQNWEIIKFKYLAKVRYGLGQPPRQLDNGLKIIRATNVERGKIVEKGMLYIDPNDIPWDRNPTLNKDEIIVVRSGAYTGDSAIVTEEYAGCIAGYDMVATPFNCYPKFLSTVLLSHYVLYEQIYLLRIRSAQPHLNAEELNELQIVVPPMNQQRLIANYIEKVESDIGEAISLIKQQLEKLKEYKTTLINDAVTGKIKVA